MRVWEDVLARSPDSKSAQMYLNLVKDPGKGQAGGLMTMDISKSCALSSSPGSTRRVPPGRRSTSSLAVPVSWTWCSWRTLRLAQAREDQLLRREDRIEDAGLHQRHLRQRREGEAGAPEGGATASSSALHPEAGPQGARAPAWMSVAKRSWEEGRRRPGRADHHGQLHDREDQRFPSGLSSSSHLQEERHPGRLQRPEQDLPAPEPRVLRGHQREPQPGSAEGFQPHHHLGVR